MKDYTMTEVSMNKNMKLSEHLASPSEAALSHSSKLDGLRLSPHFTLGELTKTSYKTEDENTTEGRLLPARLCRLACPRTGRKKHRYL